MDRSVARARFTLAEAGLIFILLCMSVVIGTGIQMGSALFPSLSRVFDVPVGTMALLTSVWAFTGLVTPLFGPAADRYGRVPFLLLGLALFAGGTVLCAVARTFSALLAFQILVGLGYAVSSFSLLALIGDAFSYETRGRAMGLTRLSTGIASLAGVPAATALAGAATARLPYAIVGSIGLVVLLASIFFLPRLVPRPAPVQREAPKPSLWGPVGRLARQRSPRVALLAVLSWAAIPTGTFIYLGAWMEQRFQVGEFQVGLAFAAVGIGALVGDLLMAAFSDRLGKKRSSLLGLLLLCVVLLLLPHSPGLPALLLALALCGLALEFGFGSLAALLTELDPTARGTLASLVPLLNGLATGAVPLLMKPVWEGLGYGVVLGILVAVGVGTAVAVSVWVRERGGEDRETR